MLNFKEKRSTSPGRLRGDLAPAGFSVRDDRCKPRYLSGRCIHQKRAQGPINDFPFLADALNVLGWRFRWTSVGEKVPIHAQTYPACETASNFNQALALQCAGKTEGDSGLQNGLQHRIGPLLVARHGKNGGLLGKHFAAEPTTAGVAIEVPSITPGIKPKLVSLLSRSRTPHFRL